MTTEPLNTNETIDATADAITALTKLMSEVDEYKVNTIPYPNSWTAPQLLRHVTKSINRMTKVMLTKAKQTDRDPGERIIQLKTLFLDFSKKLTQPDFIIPEEEIYKKQTSINELKTSFNKFKESINNANLNELVEGLPFGPVTKLEIVHFVLYHTQRHLYQMKKICEALKNN
ncbi:MAG TPA: DinB family protein [Chitinophagaceae bacterium]|nr:DinB family protein [Chitinophagaceae bacterium]